MKRHGIVLAVGIAATSFAARADAQADRPVLVTVVGHGAIRFRLAAGPTAPCDSSENRMLFDGWLRTGKYVFDTGADAVCFQYTSGALREMNWSESQVVLTTTGRRPPRRPMEILVPTD